MEHLSLPEQLQLSNNAAESQKKFKQGVNIYLYMLANRATEKI